MSAPLVEGEPVLILWVLTRERDDTFASLFEEHRSPIYIGQRVRRAVVSSSVIAGVVQARETYFGRNLRPLTPGGEGISWCRGWSQEARDALLAAWNLYRGTS